MTMAVESQYLLSPIAFTTDVTQSGPRSVPWPSAWSDSSFVGITQLTAGSSGVPVLGVGHLPPTVPLISQSTLALGHDTQLPVQLNFAGFVGHSLLYRTAEMPSNASHICPPSIPQGGT